MITYSYISENGGRPVNEDAVSVAKNGSDFCFTVCDGLGGHGCGDVASAETVKVFSELFEKTDLSAKDFFERAYTEANARVFELQKADSAAFGMKTTVVSLCVSPDKCIWSHLGDSRLYCFEKNSVKTRTLDHSVPQMLVQSKDIKEREIRNHPDRNKILRAIGTDEGKPSYKLSEEVSTAECSAFLLCSDGFWELITEKRMCRALRKSKTAEEWLRRMRNVVLKKGENKNMDNFSAIAIIVGK